MKKIYLLISIFISLLNLSAQSESIQNKRALFQYSIINALFQGIFDGEMTCKELKEKGDFGIGTFNNLDGEMVIINGNCYQIKSDGKVYSVLDDLKTPFAAVTFFQPDESLKLKNLLNLKQIQEYLDKELIAQNLIYAVKIIGDFKYVKARSVPRQEKKPYSKLSEVAKKQSIFEFENIKGTILGFRIPIYMDKINVPGYHFHFISKDMKTGGHVMECIINSATAKIEKINSFEMELPENDDFLKFNLNQENKTEISKVEK